MCGFAVFWGLVGVIFSSFGSLLGRFFVFWELVGVNFSCFGSLEGSFLGLERLCLPSWGPGHLQETNLGAFWNVLVPIWEAFGSHLGVMLVLCCNFLEIFFGCQIRSYLEGVSEAILGDLATS